MMSISSSLTPNLNHQSKNFPSLNPKCCYVLPKFSRKKFFSLPNLFKSIDDRISHLMDIPPSLDPGWIFSSSFTPVDEQPPTACEVVEGALPSCLDGAYIRNGPNPHFLPGQGAYHLFDGDGMLHMIRISGGGALFCSRYVKTYKYRVEEKYGHPIFPSVFSSFNGLGPSLMRIGLIFARVATGHFNPIANGFGTANTSIALIGGKLFALGESDLPYEIQVTPNGDIITLNRYNFGENIRPFLNMNAHAKIDPNTKETFSLRYHVIPPRLTLLRIDPAGKKQNELPIFSLKSTSMTHDIALTRNFIIFSDSQIVLDLMQIARGKSPVKIDVNKMPRLGIAPRYVEDEGGLTWIDTEGLNIMHYCNAWEEGDTVVIVASVISSMEHVMERLDMAGLKLERITINLRTKSVNRESLANEWMDMGVINPAYAGNKNRYVYATIIAETDLAVGLAKIDLASPSGSLDYIVARHWHDPKCCGGEPFFVAREPNNPMAEEDDGYLVMYVDDRSREESKFLVLDAKSPTLETVAVVKLPGRVPTGFHGLFLREDDIKKLG